MTIIETVFLVLVMLLVAFSMRTVVETKRIAIFRLGRYTGLKGPGVVMVVPVMDRPCLITLGDHGVLMADGMGKFREFQVPVEFQDSIPAGSSVRVVGFTKERLQVV